MIGCQQRRRRRRSSLSSRSCSDFRGIERAVSDRHTTSEQRDSAFALGLVVHGKASSNCRLPRGVHRFTTILAYARPSVGDGASGVTFRTTDPGMSLNVEFASPTEKETRDCPSDVTEEPGQKQRRSLKDNGAAERLREFTTPDADVRMLLSTSSSCLRSGRRPPPPPSSPALLCEQISSQYSQASVTAKSLLETMIRNHSMISFEYTPLETYAKEQSVRTAHDTLRRLNSMTLTREDLFEHIENIVASFRLYQNRYSLEGAVMAFKCLRVYVAAITEYCYYLEYLGGMALTNWDDCSKFCEMELRSLRIRSTFNAIEYVPRIQDFQTVRPLGGGGFGVVYEAIHIPTDMRVCVKLIITSRLKKLSYAALDKIVASVSDHPKLVQCYVSFLTSQAYVTVMEYVGGVDVMKYVTGIGEVTQLPNHYCAILNQMAKAVAYLHANGFIHRDIKPQNALLLPGGHIKLIDFDTCKICVAHFVETRPMHGYFARTAAEYEDKDYAGTLHFMAPEVIDHRPYGRSVDWWSIGVTAYRLIAGKLPFRDKDRDRLKDAIRRSHPRMPEWSGPLEQDFVGRLLTKDPQFRLGSETYVELIHHELFDYYDADRPLDERYFDTTPMQDLLRKQVLKKSRNKKKNVPYLELRDCTSVPLDEQKQLLVFASFPWRMLVRPDDSILPLKTDLQAEHDMDILLDAPEILAADAFPSAWGANELCQLTDTSTSIITGGSLLSLNSRLIGPFDEYVKQPCGSIQKAVKMSPEIRKQEKRTRKKKRCALM
ncbi:microtubule-associated serine/threonine-protein kinase 2-like [Tropilaelaps mercedesae]|uniref:Microtubule-associated serine/threonine-protein kinase 2-like n=1 Tax=Tropilaelaps mercedesae TaxID=418985 RepID=A0A1V9XBP6_9ACAR|nr:microtubule-associated serine/threonine-protein kinase 2-like [Tropilaelaps mercedesae]